MATTRSIIILFFLIFSLPASLNANDIIPQSEYIISNHFILTPQQTSNLIYSLFRLYEQEDTVSQKFPGKIFTNKTEESWFDTPSFELLKNKTYVVTNKTQIEAVNKNTIYAGITRDHDRSDTELTKYQLGRSRRNISLLDRHELIGSIHPRQREYFIKGLQLNQKIDLSEITKILESISTSLVYQLKLKKRVFFDISVSKISARSMGVEKVFSTLETNIYKNNIDLLNNTEKEELMARIAEVKAQVMESDNLSVNTNTRFMLIWKTMIDEYPFIGKIVKYPFAFQILQLIVFCFCGAIGLILFFRKRLYCKKQKMHRITVQI